MNGLPQVEQNWLSFGERRKQKGQTRLKRAESAVGVAPQYAHTPFALDRAAPQAWQ